MSAQRPTVVVAIKGLGIGGAEKLIAEGARFWDRDRFDYQVAYALPWKDQLVNALTDQGIPVTCFGSKRGLTPNSAVRFSKLVKQADAALVHAHLPSMGAVARVSTRTPVIYTEHNIASSYRRPVQFVNRLTYSRNAAAIAVSEAVFSSIDSYPSPSKRVIPNGVHVRETFDTAAVDRELSLGNDQHLVVHVGNIRPHKGHRTLVAAAKHLSQSRDDFQIVSIGGEKTEGDLASMRKLAADTGVSDHIRFLGRRNDALAFTAACEVYVNPADVEGLPVTILEALDLGRPVVATSVGGVPSIISDGKTGVLVPPGSPEAISEGIAWMLDHPQEAQRLGAKGKDLVNTQYGLERMVRDTEAVYDEVLGG
jgi:glycosyltransferase involved in cell wall biosynthesis